MCGIAGFLTSSAMKSAENTLQCMLDRIKHRGPDSQGVFYDKNIAIGMKRLAIIDIDSGGQPIFNEDQSICIIFNGEIYNAKEHRELLIEEGHIFSTKTDTEVIVHLYEKYGDDVTCHLNGMFAFCIYDKVNQKFLFAVDRIGKKPLFYYSDGQNFVFSSELKSILEHPHIQKKIDESSLEKYFLYGYVPAPCSIISNVNKLTAGHTLIVDVKTYSYEVKPYWEFDYKNKTDAPVDNIISTIEEKLSDAVERRLISDVPLGVFLSGGVDSSLIVALMSRFRKGQDIKTFSIGFKEKQFDESKYAREVADLYHTDHHVRMFQVDEALNVISEIIDKLDEPFSDPSLLPTYLLSHYTRQNNIIVALSGDGGDEMFGGYPKYYIHQYARYFDMLPPIIRTQIFNRIFKMIPLKPENKIFNYKVERFMECNQYPDYIRNQLWVSPFLPADLKKLLNRESSSDLAHEIEPLLEKFNGKDMVDKMMFLDAKMMLQNMFLTKVDRASMAVSLEVRSPFLDSNVVKFVSSIPSNLKVHGRETKYILKKVAEKYLPNKIVYRFKKGFGIPLAHWIKKLSPDIFDLLEKQHDGLFNYRYIHHLLNEHLSGQKDNSTKIWSLYIFFRWRENLFGNK